MASANAEVAEYKALAARMQDLIGHFSWDSYCEQLESTEKDLLQRMLSGDKDQFEYLKGRIEGLREAVHMPAHIVARAKGMTSNG